MEGMHVKMEINFGNVNGFMLAAALNAEIDEPHLALTADGKFKNYTFDAEAASTAQRNAAVAP
ncbi:MAG: hypothetical protein WAK19_17190 [Candidatus Cybelea sp.]